ncbi:hypothetical protein [Synechocystis sp. PCC 7509]|uniref:hypothetical protein n=1 Tax=Synechocystis sp. PCC 7509 TaxID=927677 RepID=UPI0002ABB125|nr:hypothetical protein [Synechocystis sp. PCC 7509]
MTAIAKLKLSLNLLVVAPLAASLAMIGSLSTVHAQTQGDRNLETRSQLPAEIAQFSVNSQPIPAEFFLEAAQHEATAHEFAEVSAAINNPQSSLKTIAANPENLDSTQLQPTKSINAPFPGTTATDATVLSTPINQSPIQPDAAEVAQLPLIPGRSTRGGSSYVGVAGNIGLSGDTALGDGNFAIISKIGLTRSLAVRPGVILGNDATILLPLTYEFSIRQAEALEEVLPIAPYIGAGITIYTGDDDDDSNDDDGGVGLLLTGGVDIPLSRQFTANAGLNVGIGDETDIGLSVGVGYNFSGLGL